MGASSKKQKVGYRYYVGFHLAPVYGPVDELTQIRVDERVAWSGSSSGGSISISAENLFGGEKREGGISGQVDLMMGEASQPVNSYLQSKIGGVVPAFRGVVSLVARRVYIGTNPYLKKWWATFRRTDILTDGTPQWYLAKANISGDMNPVHIVRECLTNQEWGMGYPTSSVDDANFQAVADTLYSESFGLSLLWNRSDRIEAFLQSVMDHINAVLVPDPVTGLFKIILIRDDYTPASLPLFDPSNVIELVEFERRGWGEAINEVTVVYRDRATGKDTPVTVQDIGGIQAQGATVNQTKRFMGISSADLAMRVAMRDLATLSAALSSLKIKVNRTAYALVPGDVFRFSWPKLGLTDVVYRVAHVDRGALERGAITVTAVQDVFGLPSAVYSAQQPSGWVDPIVAPVPATYQRLIESSYWDVQMNVSQADIANLDPDFGFLGALVERPSDGSYNFDLLTKVGSAEYVEQITGEFCPTAVITAAIGLGDTVLVYGSEVDIDQVEMDEYGYLDDEVVAVKAIDTGAKTVTVARGVLDTVPQAHAAGTRLWFADGWAAVDKTERVDAEVVDAKMLPTTGLGTLNEASATALQITLDNRYQRPYAPGNVKANGVSYNPATSGDIAFTWAHRDRTLQTAYLVEQSEGDIGPEAGTTYTLRVYDVTGAPVLKHTESGLSGTAFTYTQAARQTDFGGVGPHNVRIEIESVRSGLTSWQMHRWDLTASDV